MLDFSFEDTFCKHFVSLRKCFEVFVSFNIDQCLSKVTDKISISLYYDEKLDIGRGNDSWIQQPESVNSVNVVGKFLAKSQHILLILTMAAYFSIVNLYSQLASNSNDRLTKFLYTVILLMTNRPEITS